MNLWISSGISTAMCMVFIYRLLIGWFRISKNFLSCPPGGGFGGEARGQRGEFSLAYLKPCVWCLYLGYLIGWFRIWKNFFDPAPLGADSGGGQSYEFPLSYLQPCVWCLYLFYLIGWFRIWKNFFDPAPLGRIRGGGGKGAKRGIFSGIS